MSKKLPRVDQSPSPSQLLARFKSLWASGQWSSALPCYREWTNRTGARRSALLEGEMLLRSASQRFGEGRADRAIEELEEAIARDPQRGTRYLRCKALCMAKRSRLKESIALYDRLGDAFHVLLLSMLNERGLGFPRETTADFAVEQTQLLRLWRSMGEDESSELASPALRNIHNAFRAMKDGGDPEPQLKSLMMKPGFEGIAGYLTFLDAVSRGRNLKARNLISANPRDFLKPELLALVDVHLRRLMKEKDYREIEVVETILSENGIRPPSLERARNRRLFNSGLEEALRGRYREAFELFGAIGEKTPALSHNLAILHQNMDDPATANAYWIPLLQAARRPKLSDPEAERLEYVTMLKCIAANFKSADEIGKALTYWKEAMGFNPLDREAMESLVFSYVELGEHGQAIPYAKRLFELEPENELYRFNYVMSLTASGRDDVVVPLLEELCAFAGSFYKELLADRYLNQALSSREHDDGEIRKLMEKARALTPDSLKLAFLDGFSLYKAGMKEEAEELFRRVVDLSKEHGEQLVLGIRFHMDGFEEHALELFRKILACDCMPSEDIFCDAITYLAKQGDKEMADRLCDEAVDEYDYPLYVVSDLLFSAGRASWAKGYSSRLIDQPTPDKWDWFLHLLILNDIGDPAETLDFAEEMRERFRGDDPFLVEELKSVIKQVKKKGRARISYE